jgi:hypothetical protein
MEAIRGLRFPFFIGGVWYLECPLLEVPLTFHVFTLHNMPLSFHLRVIFPVIFFWQIRNQGFDNFQTVKRTFSEEH